MPIPATYFWFILLIKSQEIKLADCHGNLDYLTNHPQENGVD